MQSSVLQFMEELIEFMLNLSGKTVSIMIINIVGIVLSMLVVRFSVALGQCIVSHVRVARSIMVSIWMPDRVVVALPVVRADLNTMNIVVLINMLRVMLTIVKI